MTSVTSNASVEELRRLRQELRSNIQDIDTRLKQTYVPGQFRITTSATNNQRTFSSSNGQPTHELSSSVKRARVSSSSLDESQSSLPENHFDEANSTSQVLHSSIVPTNKIIKTKDELISLVNRDQRSADRNRRMFGVLLGTLNKFKQEANAYSEQTVGIKRQEIERRLEERQAKEREDKQHERTELIASKRTKQQELKHINMKLEILERISNREKSYLRLRNFFRTKCQPVVFFLPKGPFDENLEKKLQESQAELDREMEEFRQRCQEELDLLEKSSSSSNNETNEESVSQSSKKRKLTEENDDEEEEDDALADLPDEITLSAPDVKMTDSSNAHQPLKSSISTSRTVIYDEESSNPRQDEPSPTGDD